MGALDWLSTVLLGLGCFLSVTGGVGVLRMPDFYTRLHPAGKNDSLGALLVLVGLCFQLDWGADWLVGARLALIALFLALTAPTATHAITKAAILDGLEPWVGPGDHEHKALSDVMAEMEASDDRGPEPARRAALQGPGDGEVEDAR